MRDNNIMAMDIDFDAPLSNCACGAGCEINKHYGEAICTLEASGYFDEGPCCPSCDGLVSENAVTCPCGAVIDPERFWVDPMPGASFEERMAMEVTLENEERAMYGAPLIPEF